MRWCYAAMRAGGAFRPSRAPLPATLATHAPRALHPTFPVVFRWRGRLPSTSAAPGHAQSQSPGRRPVRPARGLGASPAGAQLVSLAGCTESDVAPVNTAGWRRSALSPRRPRGEPRRTRSNLAPAGFSSAPPVAKPGQVLAPEIRTCTLRLHMAISPTLSQVPKQQCLQYLLVLPYLINPGADTVFPRKQKHKTLTYQLSSS